MKNITKKRIKFVTLVVGGLVAMGAAAYLGDKAGKALSEL